jgi:hypothetical protein
LLDLSVRLDGSNAMDQDKPKLVRTASALILFPIVGLLGGLILGATWNSFYRGRDEFAELHLVLRWGVTGFFLGLALVVVVSLNLRRKDLVSLRRLMVLVVIVSLLVWFFARILFGVIG